MALEPDLVQDLALIAFTYDAIAEKPGCVSRSADHEDKKLDDFLLAGINSSKYFRYLAHDMARGRSGVFAYFVPALQESQRYRSSKAINLGLLEIMFPVVYGRQKALHAAGVLDSVLDCLQDRSAEDVRALIEARRYAWQTSTKPEKNADTLPHDASSAAEFYALLHNHADAATRQWGEQLREGLPLLRRMYIDLLHAKQPVLTQIPVTFTKQRERFPDVKIGIVSDMCAAATYLALSYREH